MNKKFSILLLCLFLCSAFISAQEKSSLQQRAEAEQAKGNPAGARSLYIKAFDDYAAKKQLEPAVECGVKATAIYQKENAYKEAFEFLHTVDQAIGAEKDKATRAALRYEAAKGRMQLYMGLRKKDRVEDQLENMEKQAAQSGRDELVNDALYNRAIFHYSFGQSAQGDAVFKELAAKLTAQKEYDKVDNVYQTLIANGRRSGNAQLVAQAYTSYIAWKDSVGAIKRADEIGALKKQIADHEASIAEKDSALSTRWIIIIGLCILAAALAAVLILGAVILLRFVMITQKQKKTIRLANETNALKAKFISNISSQLEPTLRKLDAKLPEVQAMLSFSDHIQTLSDLENSEDEVLLEDTQILPFCEALADEVRGLVKPGVTLTLNVPKMNASINREYVTHILKHLLANAAEYTPADGKIWLDFKKRSPHKYQFLVSNTGEAIPEEKREDVFKPFLEVHDLTKGDGLGLPICRQMAVRMKGDLYIDPEFVKGTRFALDLFA